MIRYARQFLYITLACVVITIIISIHLFSVKASTAPISTPTSATFPNKASVTEVVQEIKQEIKTSDVRALVNKEEYDKKVIQNANIKRVPVGKVSTSTKTSTSSTTTVATSTLVKSLWPAKTVYHLEGALLPFNRIVAYYGNFYSKNMGVLGQYPKTEMLAKLNGEVEKWKLADPTTPVIPAIDYIALTAQGTAGDSGYYSLRMPSTEIDKAVALANEIGGIVILDTQVGQSNVKIEIPLLEKYLKMPNVHLALDPEFSMKKGQKPGTVIGTMDATDINYVANYLAKLVKDNNIPPKILIVHRFTTPMITHSKSITPLPEVQIVIDMDGWSMPSKKIAVYNQIVASEPVEFTGFKLFYKNDLRAPSTRMTTTSEILNLTPQPVFIQYQ